ncbi:matrixin family metalloprotease [Streptomyces sp. NPDC127084]|uniref:matrixin family metalloprotease n=1 Tax=Streptomyces sp. NPDC127084 TaxID=3347133 RepID=UPI00365BA6C6
MRTSWRSRTVAVAAAFGCVTISAPQSHAYDFEFWPGVTCKYNAGGNTLKWSNVTSSYTYSNPAQLAISAWNSTSTQFNFTQVNTGANLRVADGNFGNVSYDGIILDASGVNRETDSALAKCRDSGTGFWQETNTAWINRKYADSYPAAKRKSIFVHEIGHALGLAHEDDLGCAIMNEGSYTRYDECGLHVPAADDIAGANALY